MPIEVEKDIELFFTIDIDISARDRLEVTLSQVEFSGLGARFLSPKKIEHQKGDNDAIEYYELHRIHSFIVARVFRNVSAIMLSVGGEYDVTKPI